MKQKIIKSLIGDLIVLFLLIFCLSRIHYICENIPVVAILFPVIWFLFGIRFILKKKTYGGIVKDNILNKCGLLCMLIGIFSLIFVIGAFLYKF